MKVNSCKVFRKSYEEFLYRSYTPVSRLKERMSEKEKEVIKITIKRKIKEFDNIISKTNQLNFIFGVKGIYFLKDRNNIVYVGESQCIISRIIQHAQEGKKKFNNYYYIKFDGSTAERKEIEASWIKLFNPDYNIQHSH